MANLEDELAKELGDEKLKKIGEDLAELMLKYKLQNSPDVCRKLFSYMSDVIDDWNLAGGANNERQIISKSDILKAAKKAMIQDGLDFDKMEDMKSFIARVWSSYIEEKYQLPNLKQFLTAVDVEYMTGVASLILEAAEYEPYMEDNV